MATSNSRDVKLAVEIQAAGEENLQRLAAEVRALGKAGGDAAPRYLELATEIERVAAQARELSAFKTAAAGINEATVATAAAVTAAEKLSAAYREQQAATETVRAAQAGVRAALDATKLAIADQIKAQDLLKASRLAGKASDEAYAKDASDIAIKLANLKQQQTGLNVELGQAKTATRDANTALSTLAATSLAASANAGKLQGALSAQTGALQAAQAAGARLGADFTNVAAAQERLDASLRGGVAALEASAAAGRQKADADKVIAAAARDAAAATEMQARAQQVLDGIRKAAFQLNAATQIKAEADAQRELTAEKTRAERIEVALNNIRRLASGQSRAAEIKAEAAATLELAAAAERVGRVLPDAFGAVGVRSIQAIQAEINQTARALRVLEAQQQAGAISTLDLARATGAAQLKLQQLRGELAQMPAAVGVFERMNGQVMDLVTRFGALSVAITTVGFAVKPVYDATVQLESMRRVLTQVFGSADEAAKAIDFVSKVANDAGVSIKSVAGDFTKFAASAKTAGIETETIKEVFASVAGAVGNLGLGSEQASRILTALAQSASKGKIQMEELGQQLGDALPGALGLLAKGLDITQPQLVKLIESGRLLTDQALKPLAQAMLELSAPNGRVESTAASFARLGNAITETYRKIGDSAAFKLLGKAAGALAENFDTAVTAVKLLGEALLVNKILTAVTNFATLRAAVTATTVATVEATVATTVNTTATTANTTAKVANAVATAGIGAALSVVAPAAKTAADGLVGLNFGLNATAPAAVKAATGAGLAAQAMGALGTAGRGLAAVFGGIPGLVAQALILGLSFRDELGRAAAALVGFGDKSNDVKKKLEAVEKVIKTNAAARTADGDSIVKLNVLYAEQAKVLDSATATNEKLADATKARGEASVLAAGLSGNERDKIVATTLALEQEVVSLGRLAEGKAAEAKLTADLIAQVEKSIEGKGRLQAADQARLDTLITTRDLLGHLTVAEKEEIAALLSKQAALVGSTAATRAQIDADKLKLAGQQASADAAQAQAEKQKALADAAGLAAAALKDNSGRVLELKTAYQNAVLTVDAMRAALERGEVTQEAFNRSVIAAGAAQGLLKNAMEDVAKSGVDLAQVQTGVSEAFFKTTGALHGTITTLKDLKLTAEQASPQLSAALDKQIEAAKTRQELEFVKAEVLRARDAFLLMGGDAAAALDKITRKAESLSPALQQAQRDATLLGVTLKDKIGQGAEAGVEVGIRAYERLKHSGKASTEELGQAFATLANQAIKAAGGVVPEWVKVEAAIRGATIETDKTGRAFVRVRELADSQIGGIVGIFNGVTDATKRAEDAALRYGSALQSAKYDADKFALGPDGQRLTATGADPYKAKGGAPEELVKALRDAEDRYGNFNKYNLTTGVSPATNEAKREEARKALDAARSAYLAAGGQRSGGDGLDVEGKKRDAEAERVRANEALGTRDLSTEQANSFLSQARSNSASADRLPGSVASRTITINLGGSSRSVTVASEGDARRLEDLFKQLETAARSAGGRP